jgi:hypothetical protein
MISVVLAAELPITDDINAIAARLVATLAARLGHLPCYGPDWGLTSRQRILWRRVVPTRILTSRDRYRKRNFRWTVVTSSMLRLLPFTARVTCTLRSLTILLHHVTLVQPTPGACPPAAGSNRSPDPEVNSPRFGRRTRCRFGCLAALVQ